MTTETTTPTGIGEWNERVRDGDKTVAEAYVYGTKENAQKALDALKKKIEEDKS